MACGRHDGIVIVERDHRQHGILRQRVRGADEALRAAGAFKTMHPDHRHARFGFERVGDAIRRQRLKPEARRRQAAEFVKTPTRDALPPDHAVKCFHCRAHTLPSSALTCRCNKDSKKQANRSARGDWGDQDVTDLNRPIHGARRDRDSEKRNNSICSWQRGLRKAYLAIQKYVADIVRELTSPATWRKQGDAKQPAGSRLSLLVLRLIYAFIEQPFCQNAKCLMKPMSAWSRRPRTAAGHWWRSAMGRIERYQINGPTTWNFRPRNSFDADGPL